MVLQMRGKENEILKLIYKNKYCQNTATTMHKNVEKIPSSCALLRRTASDSQLALPTSSYMSTLKIRRATMRFEAEEDEEDDPSKLISDEPPQLLFELEMPPPKELNDDDNNSDDHYDNDNDNNNNDIQTHLKKIADEMQMIRTSMQYLVAENALLRRRQAEREKLAHELGMQKHYASATAQLIQITQQQAAMLDALRAFSLTFDVHSEK